MSTVSSIPQGFASVTPTMIVKGAVHAMEAYKQAFGAQEVHRMMCPQSGKVMHACLQLGSSKIFLCDANPEAGCASPTTSSFYVYLDNVDAVFSQAKKAGMQEVSAVQEMFWGDRTGTLTDAWGNKWTLATHVRDVSDQEMQEAMKKMASGKAA